MTASPADPTGQVELLHQCLAGDKKPIGFFLGAGCPVAIRVPTEGGDSDEPLIPDVATLTAKVRESIGDSDELSAPFARIEEQLRDDHSGSATVEDMLTHIRSLAAVAGQGEVRGLTAQQLSSLDQSICDVIHGLVDQDLPEGTTPYHMVAKWTNSVRRDHPVEVFTPNYDLLIEQAMEETRTPYFDGFPGIQSPLFDAASVEDPRLPAHWARIWKLHGSINWYQSPAGDVFRSTKSGGNDRRVIHPSHLKHEASRRMPYLAMLDRLRNFLRGPTAALILCGYSFRDGHINDTIAQGLQYTRTSVSYGLLFGNMSEYPRAIELARDHPNLNLLALDGGIIGSREVEWCRPATGAGLELSGGAISWCAMDEEGAETLQRGKCRLGDFAVFAEFLSSLSGSAQRPEHGA